VTEQEAAERLCALLNEVEAAGYQISWSSSDGYEGLFIGDIQIAEPPCGDEPWEVRS
jgi:hypothetical protein